MEVNILKKEGNTLLVELKGESETFANLIREELWNVKGVIEAAHIKEHPELAEPKIWIKTDGLDPMEALKIAVENLLKKFEEIKKSYKKQL
ncbi:MAG: RpoL/Rpb11 RNA polymerase subunit family protein [Candidatus Aenigmatarchaeota archaeon]